MAKITVYSKNNCMQCKMTKRYLTEHNVKFEEHNINEQPEYVDYLKNKGFYAVPVVDVDGQQAFSGFRPDELQKIAG
ncbi:glutaredoxin-like protein NrdH [Lentilactobacillus farraginis]|uniref:Glutaredoxin-like protein NrdH n=2 Tax=Lentilactobacillus farraginis DSM 18382 = JCM 14108 TaxID=1423743 RepID=X0PAI4_9LACO|nr:glutaredoxin-like protein NrdH [Lentilactobacillus farraginis]GAF36554.1 glutaredoxin-like protein NrdH [Lentilactobacillus farraginis DSM 18382 = JCM 14108]